jgi:Flp pilus assembly pilin Flp
MSREQLPSQTEESDTMMNSIRNFVRDEQGEDLIEYGLLAAFVAAVAVAVLSNGGLRAALQGVFTRVIADLAI